MSICYNASSNDVSTSMSVTVYNVTQDIIHTSPFILYTYGYLQIHKYIQKHKYIQTYPHEFMC